MKCPHCDHVNIAGAENCEACQLDLTPFDEPVPRDRVEQSLLEDAVSCLGSKNPIVTPGTISVREAIQILIQHDIGALLVVDEEGNLAGIFSERDLLTKVAHETNPPLDHPISELMTTKIDTVKSDDILAYVVHQMNVGGHRHVPVVEDGKPIGVISVRDMLKHITNLCRN